MTPHLLRLALASGRTEADAEDWFNDRAAQREFCGGQSRAEAEREAEVETEQWLRETKGQGK